MTGRYTYQIRKEQMETMNTKTETQNRALNTVRLVERVTDDCTGEACPLGVCSPCLIVWGLVGVFLIISALLQAFS